MLRYIVRVTFLRLIVFAVAGVLAIGLAFLPLPTFQKLDDYIGQYRDPADAAVFSFFREGERFFVEISSMGRGEIVRERDDTFVLKAVGIRIDFIRDANGKVGSIAWRQGDERFSIPKISDQPAASTYISFGRREVEIPMRDGVRLHTVILAPEKQSDPLPIILQRTPYGADGHTSDSLNNGEKELVRESYVFVFQDIRGRGKSQGEFAMLRPPRDKSIGNSIDETTDAHDTIEWLVKNVRQNNGRVAIKGVSYDGWLATMALLEPHPALKAGSPQAPVADLWIGDDYFHNGAFRQTYGYEHVKAMESASGAVSFGATDAYDWYLGLKTLAGLTLQLGNTLPTWNNFVAHPTYDSFWKSRSVNEQITQALVPSLVVGGWWDPEDRFGALETYKALEKHDKNDVVSLVEGPWIHGGWYHDGDSLGDVDFGTATGVYFRRQIQAPWLAYYLKGKGTLKQPEATIFQAGLNRWMSYDSWPPRNVRPLKLYLHSKGRLLFEPPEGGGTSESDSFVSDPNDPIPYRKRPIEATYDPKGSRWGTWLAQDQSFLDGRKDILMWQSDPLTEEITITGDVIARLFASTTGTDSDWIVKLIDVYPAGGNAKAANYKLMVTGEIFRGRYLKSFENPQPLKAGEVYAYTIDLRDADYTFLKGHRIMVQIQSSWFPLYDRNPQSFVPNIFLAREGDFRRATHSVYRSSRFPSHIEVSTPATMRR